MKEIKIWRIVRIICIVLLFVILSLFIGFLIYRGHVYMKLSYPQPMLGLDVQNWFEALMIDAALILHIAAIPLFAVVLTLIVSTVCIRKLKKIPDLNGISNKV